MDTFFQILGYSIPALVVFATVYFFIKKFFDTQLEKEAYEFRKANVAQITPMKLQAYERLLMLCERISIPNLMMRLSTGNDSAEGLSKAMMIAIQQEYEHNLTQQIYVSENLWKIITMAKNQTLEVISTASNNLRADDPGALIANEAIEVLTAMKADPLETAKRSIRKEMQILFG